VHQGLGEDAIRAIAPFVEGKVRTASPPSRRCDGCSRVVTPASPTCDPVYSSRRVIVDLRVQV
jgi:hypothetical protein